MGNVIGSFFSGLANSIGKLFSSPIDFLSGKSCSSVCGSWDFFCYVENFCVANLLKMAIALFLSYIVLLFVYLLYKVGMCHCIGHGLCKMLWACVCCWFSFWEHCLGFLFNKLLSLRRKRVEQGRVYENSRSDDTDISGRSVSRRRRDHKRVRLRKSLRPRSYHVQVGINKDSVSGHRRRYRNPTHQIRVSRTSKFAHKRLSYAHRDRNRRQG